MQALREQSRACQEQRAPLRWGSCRGFLEELPAYLRVLHTPVTLLPGALPRHTSNHTTSKPMPVAKLPSIFLRKKGDRLHLAPPAFGMVCPGSEGSSRGLRFGGSLCRTRPWVLPFASSPPVPTRRFFPTRTHAPVLPHSCPHSDPPSSLFSCGLSPTLSPPP